jgi:hypothetical protein
MIERSLADVYQSPLYSISEEAIDDQRLRVSRDVNANGSVKSCLR